MDGGRYGRNYLPHWQRSGATQFLTWRLGDAVPSEVIDGWKRELDGEPMHLRQRKLAARIEAYADQGHGGCLLRDGVAAGLVQHHLLAGHGARFVLHAWAVMPNHVHVLLTPGPDSHLPELIQFLKGGSAHRVNRLLGRKGPLWQGDYFDRLIRDEEHFMKVLYYIECNPAKAGLVGDPKAFPYSSAYGANRERLKWAAGTEVPAPDAG